MILKLLWLKDMLWRKEKSEAVRTLIDINVEGWRGREKSKKRWLNVIEWYEHWLCMYRWQEDYV